MYVCITNLIFRTHLHVVFKYYRGDRILLDVVQVIISMSQNHHNHTFGTSMTIQLS